MAILSGANMLSKIKLFLLVTSIMVQLCDQIVHARENSGKTDTFEGDIEISNREREELAKQWNRNGAIGHPKKWKDGKIPYKISKDFDNKERERQILQQAMKEISSYTCIQFKKREKDEKDFVEFIATKNKCSSHVGKTGGRQNIKLKPSCMKLGTVIHELMHAIGFWHEQSRMDRNKFVKVHWDNINKVNRRNFEEYTDPYSTDFGLPYDYGSLMHYSEEAFQKERGLKTLVPQFPGVPIGLRSIGMSYFDKLKINKLYNCPPRQRY